MFQLTPEYPVGVSGGEPGVLRGSTIKLIAVSSQTWVIESNLIVNSGLSSGKIFTPYTNY